MTRKSVLRSVRLDDDVWAAVKELDVSLNQYLRTALLWEEETAETDKIPTEIPANSQPFKGELLKPGAKKKGRQ